MAALNIRGRVMCFPGTVPLRGATVEIIDVDKGGNGDDIIFTGTTDDNGYFQGTSNDWKDRNTEQVTTPWGSHDIEIPDILMLMARIRKDTRDTGRIPFALALSSTPITAIVPIVVPWSCSVGRKPKVNGVECNDGYELQVKARAAFERRDPTVRTHSMDQMQGHSFLMRTKHWMR